MGAGTYIHLYRIIIGIVNGKYQAKNNTKPPLADVAREVSVGLPA